MVNQDNINDFKIELIKKIEEFSGSQIKWFLNVENNCSDIHYLHLLTFLIVNKKDDEFFELLTMTMSIFLKRVYSD